VPSPGALPPPAHNKCKGKEKRKKKKNKNSKELCLGYVISFLPVKDLVEVSQLF